MASPLHVGTWTRPSMFAALVLALAGSAALVTAALVGGNCERKRERVERRAHVCGGRYKEVRDRDRACLHALRQAEGLRLRLGDDSPVYIERRDALLKACIVK